MTGGGAVSRAGEVARHTVLEAVRDKVFVVSILFAATLLGAALALSPLASGEREKLVQDLGLGAIAAIGLLLAIFVGTSIVYREMERRTIYTLLARPVGRSEYLVGKYIGMVATIAFNVAIMFVLYAAVVHFDLGTFHVELAEAAYLIGVELAVITAFSLFFSVVASPFLGAFFTLILFVAGHLTADVIRFSEMLPPGVGRAVFRGAAYVLPNLELFNIKGMAVYNKPVTWQYIAGATGYAALYIVALVLLSVVIFRRKDLK